MSRSDYDPIEKPRGLINFISILEAISVFILLDNSATMVDGEDHFCTKIIMVISFVYESLNYPLF